MIDDRADFMRIDYEREDLEKRTIEKLIREIRKLRRRSLRNNNPLITSSYNYIIIQALNMYKRQKERVLRNKDKKKKKGVQHDG